MSTVAELMPEAIRTRNLKVLSACVDALRFKCGMTYAEVFEVAKKMYPTLSDTSWESLMYEMDEEL